jgi:hypothetical protein
MKTLVIENWQMQDIPDELQDILDKGKVYLGELDYWTSFYKAFWPENRKETYKRFLSLENGDNIIAQTVFEDFQQLELMSMLLNKLTEEKDIRLNVYIVFLSLKDELNTFFEKAQSSITPQTPEYDDSYELRLEYKRSMNREVLNAIRNHNLYSYSRYRRDPELIIYTDQEISEILADRK